MSSSFLYLLMALPQGVDLSGEELSALPTQVGPQALQGPHEVFALPWFQNVTVSGYVATGFLDLGRSGFFSEGGFTVRQSSLFVDARAWEGMSVFAELWLSRLSQYRDEELRTGELYVRLHDLDPDESGEGIDVKIGRIDIPFGEEYLRQDAPDNPLISQSTAWLYGVDEGALASGRAAGLHWTAAIMDGSDARNLESDASKAVALKLAGGSDSRFAWSLSALHGGEEASSAIKFAGMTIEPVGTNGAPSSAGASPSAGVESTLFGAAGAWTPTDEVDVLVELGRADIADEAPGFDRELSWYSVEPRWKLAPKVTVALRWSEVGTFDDDEGYRLHGSFIGFGTALGYDTQRLSRGSIGVAYDMNPHARVKLEVARDNFTLIDGSASDATNDDRTFYGLEVVLSF